MQQRNLFFLAFIFVAVIACVQKPSILGTGIGYRDTILIDIGGEPPTLDPAMAGDNVSFRVLNDLFEGLVSFDQQNKPVPGLAESWVISSDGRTYIFKLRPNLKFSDDTNITSEDVIKSWKRFADPKTGAEQSNLVDNIINGSAILKGRLSANKLGVSADDPLHVTVRLVYPDPYFVDKLSSPGFAVVPVKVIAKYGKSWTEPEYMVTSGAYRLTGHVVNGYLTADKNRFYYDAANVKTPHIKYLAISDPNAAFNQYQTGGLDLTSTIPLEKYRYIRQNLPDQLHVVQQNAIYYYDFNMLDPVLKSNLKLRQALSMAVDRENLTRHILGQGQRAMYSVIPDTVADGVYKGTHYYWESWGYTRRLAIARELLAEAGYNSTHPLNLTISYNTLDSHKKIALAIASMWQEGLGINVRLKNQEWKTFLVSRKQGNYQIARDGWIADNNVASFTEFMFPCQSPQNNSHYCNSRYDDLIKKSKAATDPLLKEQLNYQAVKLVLDDYPVIPLYQYVYLRLVSPRVHGYYPENNHNDSVLTKWIWLD